MRKYDNLFQIGEVAYLLGISRKMVLDYETAELIAPTVVDETSGYRYFDAEAIARLQIILSLRQADMPIKQIARYLQGRLTADEQIKSFQAQIKHIEEAIEELRLRTIQPYTISPVKEMLLPAQTCICKAYRASDVETAIAAVTDTYYDCLKHHMRLARKANHFCEFPKDILSEDIYDTVDIPMRICIAVEGTNLPSDVVLFPKTKAVAVTYCGSYDGGIAAYNAIKKHIIAHQYTPAGYPREFYIEGNFHHNGENNIVLVTVPVQ